MSWEGEGTRVQNSPFPSVSSFPLFRVEECVSTVPTSTFTYVMWDIGGPPFESGAGFFRRHGSRLEETLVTETYVRVVAAPGWSIRSSVCLVSGWVLPVRTL